MKITAYIVAILLFAGRSTVWGVDGYATINGTTTGGEGAPTVTVTNLLDLIKYAGSNAPCTVQVVGSIVCPTRVTVKSDKTIVGLGTNATINGNVYLSGVTNVVIRNLFITNPTDDNADGPDDEDGITVVNGTHHVWIDHCTFYDCLDGEADITRASDFVTVSWCKFFYTANTNGHNFVNLIGGDDADTGDTGKLHVTFHHNWWSALCVERMPRVRFGQVHVYNNYYGCSGNNYCIRAARDSELRIENNRFQSVDTPWETYITIAATGKVYATGNLLLNCTGTGVPAVDTVFTPPYVYTLDGTNLVASVVTNGAGAGRLPIAAFTASPTNGTSPPLLVTFTDTSTGIIEVRSWDFGDGTTTNVTDTSVTHSYTNLASYDVSLSVSGPVGTNVLTRSGCITIAHQPPELTGDLTVTNSELQVGNVAVVVVGDTNVFDVGATDPGGNPLSFQWYFGDGTTNDWSSSGTAEHVYATNCGPYTASVTISNGETTVTSNFAIAVACQLNITKLQPKLSFSKPNADQCTVAATFDVPADYDFVGKPVTLAVGGAEVSFTLDSKGGGVNGFNKFSKPKYNRTTGLWTLKATLKKGSWQTPWADYSMINSNIPKPGILVSGFPVILLLDNEAFMGTTNLHYTATQDKSGAAK